MERAETRKVGLRTREPSIMHVPRPRCDRQINSMENGRTKKGDGKARDYTKEGLYTSCSRATTRPSCLGSLCSQTIKYRTLLKVNISSGKK